MNIYAIFMTKYSINISLKNFYAITLLIIIIENNLYER
jgi:hypothetical protein